MTDHASFQHETLNRIYRQAAENLLAAYGIHAAAAPAISADPARNRTVLVSILTAAGEGIALSSTLTIDCEFLFGLHPLNGGPITQPDLEDWCCELNNQLLGRLKNKLLEYGAVVSIGLPILLCGVNVAAAAAPDQEVTEHAIESSKGSMRFRLASSVVSTVAFLEPAERGENTPLLEGSLALF